MVKIYCIEDINDMKYVGSTTQTLLQRLSQHRSAKKLDRNTSSNQLNLEYCMIYELETCSLEDIKDRERYWINHIDCVNILKLNGRDKDKRSAYIREYNKEYYAKNKDKRIAYRDKRNAYMKEYRARSKSKDKM
tara:strand:- start:28 stop:429 length:402 start_codon:yes stop_codon:yes gene_type:complete